MKERWKYISRMIQALFGRDEALGEDDRRLIGALRASSPRSYPMSERNRVRIEAAWKAERARKSPTGYWIIGLAGVAACALVAVLWLGPAQPQPMRAIPGANEPAMVAEPTPSMTDVRMPNPRPLVAWTKRPDQPLWQEQAYLVADVTDAVRFVAARLVPDAYLPKVDAALAEVEAEVRQGPASS